MSKSANKHKFGKHYIHNLLSYLLVLLIPLAILAAFYSSRIKEKLFQEIYETVDLELAQISLQMDHQLDSMNNMVGQLTLSGALPSALQAGSPLELAPVISSLSGFRSANPFIEDMALILDRQDYVITASTTCNKTFYFGQFLSSPDLDMSGFDNLLASCPYPVAFPRTALSTTGTSTFSREMILFAYPLYSDYQTREGTMLFFVPSASVEKFLNPKLKSYHAQVYITDSSGTVITSYGEGPSLDFVFSDFSADIRALPRQVLADETDYLVRSYASNSSQWTYTAFLPDNQDTFSQVTSLTREFILAILMILFLSGCVIWFLQKHNYAPVKKLLEQAKGLIPDGKSPEPEEAVISNEITTISNALAYLSSENTALTARLSGSQKAVKGQRLLRLLAGDYASREDFNMDCCELDLELPYPFFTAAILLIPSHAPAPESWMPEFEKVNGSHVLYHCPHPFSPGQTVLLVNSAAPGSAWTCHHILQPLRDFLWQNDSLSATIGCGSCVDSTGLLPRSCMEASSALDYRFVKGNGTIIEFHEALGSDNPRLVYPNKEFQALRNAMLFNNEENIRHTIQDIIHFMELNQPPLYLARSVCFDLIHLVNLHCQKEGGAITSLPLALSGMETSQEILQILYAWSENLTSLGKPSLKSLSFPEVISYIRENCLGCEFSAYETAEHFGMTLPAFSKYFKEMSGQNVMDYTIGLRMDKAKDLLLTTALPLKDIAGQVGYYNVSSFTRRFKAHQGVTPGDYRKNRDGSHEK